MNENKIADLRAQVQFILGRIDAANWVRQNCNLSKEDVDKLRERVQNWTISEKEWSAKIASILEARTKLKEKKKRELEEAVKRRRDGGL